MHLKRMLYSLGACVLALSLLVGGAAACGGHHGRGGCHGQRVQVQQTQTQQTRIPVCTVEGCTIAGRHVHNGTTYCGYDHASGYCNGSCLALCPVEGCTIAGRHVHDGVTYCGSNHACGYCDGSCQYSYSHCHRR